MPNPNPMGFSKDTLDAFVQPSEGDKKYQNDMRAYRIVEDYTIVQGYRTILVEQRLALECAKKADIELTAMKKELDGYKSACETANNKIHEQRIELTALHEACKEKNYWAWQGDGNDHLETLACPIIIRPEQLRALLGNKAEGDVHTFIANLTKEAKRG
jgi:hypothetical protein